MPRGSPGERGAALLAVLWFVAAVAALSIAFVNLARGDWELAAAQVDAVRARALAQEGLVRTMAVVDARRDRRLPAALVWTTEAGTVTVRLEGEAGKVDLNAATPALIEALARTVGLPEELAGEIAAAVVDWRDENDLRQAKAGAEDRDYDSADRGYGASDRPFRHVAELRYVLPVDGAAYALLAPHLTVYSGKADPERRQASPIVRAALRLRRGIKPGRDQEGEEVAEYSEGTSSSASAGGAAQSSFAADDSSPPSGPTRTPQPDEGDGGEGGGGGGGEGGGAGGSGAVHAVLLDVRLSGGYEAHARAVVGLAQERDERALRLLDWVQVVAPPAAAAPPVRVGS